MYWLYGTTQVSAIPLPYCTTGDDVDFTLTLVTETGEDLTNSYLCVILPEQAGVVSAKLSADVEYSQVSGVWNAACFLGDLGASTQTDIDFRINFPTGSSEGLTALAVYVGHGEAVTPPTDLWEDTIDKGPWFDDWSDHFWRDEW